MRRIARMLGLGVIVGLTIPPVSAGAAEITVDTTSDTSTPTTCALRDAITAANLNGTPAGSNCTAGGSSSPDLITITPSGTITLATPLPNLVTNMRIDGPGAGLLDVHRSSLASPFRVFFIAPGLEVEISGLKLSNGLVNASATVTGGGIDIGVFSAVTLVDATVADNVVSASATNAGDATAVANGGGIHVNGGRLRLIRSTVTNNTVSASSTTTGTLGTDDSLADARGGGISAGASGAEVTMSQTTVSDNTASAVATGTATSAGAVGAAAGGGVDADEIHADRSTINGNNATATSGPTAASTAGSLGGGMRNDDTADVTNSTIDGNSVAATAPLIASAIAGGGGIEATSDPTAWLTLVDSTLSSNSAAEGSNLEVQRQATLENTLLADPQGGGDNCEIPAGVLLFSDGFNLESANPGMAPPSCMLTRLSDQTGVDPMLGPLQNNGGLTMTRVLMPGSPAIDQGRSFGETLDQRSSPRPVDFPSIADAAGGDGSDIGAFELGQGCVGQSTPTASCTPSAPPSMGAATATGQRAAAIKKCKKQRKKRKKKGKPYKKKFKKCKKKANKLPV